MTEFFACVNLIILGSIAWIIRKKSDGLLHIFFWPALIFKSLAGIVLGLLYTCYYSTGDTFLYFNDGVTLAELARQDPLEYLKFLWGGDGSFAVWRGLLENQQSRVLFMVKFTSFFNLLTHDNYWITSLYFSFISFAFAWKLVGVISDVIPKVRLPAVVSFLFLPSAVFWSAGLIKESLAMAALFFLSSLVVKAWSRITLRLWEWMAMPFSLWLLWSLKYYYLAVFLPVTVTSIVAHAFFARQRVSSTALSRVVIITGAFLILLVSIVLMHPNFDPRILFGVIVSNYETFHAISAADDLIYYFDFQPTLGSMLLNAPWALISGLFRPFLWEASTLLQVLAALENLLLMFMTAFALTNASRYFKSENRLKLITLLAYSVVLCVFLALATPNFGTLSRYRVGFLPFFFLLITVYNPVGRRLLRFTERNPGDLVP